MDAKKINKESLIESVRKFPCLYDNRRQDYKDDGVRENAWKIVVCELTNMTPDSSNTVLNEDVNTVKRIFKNLRDRFMKMRREYKPSGSGGGVPIEPAWPFYKQLQFLAPFLKHRPTLDNLASTIQNPVLSCPESADQVYETSESNLINEEQHIFAIYDDSQMALTPDTVATSTLPSVPAEAESFLQDNLECSVDSPASCSVSSFERTPNCPIPTKKAKRAQQKESNSDALLKALESSNDFIYNASKKQEPDADDLFGQSIGKQLKELSPYQKSLAKLRIQQALHEVRWEKEPEL